MGTLPPCVGPSTQSSLPRCHLPDQLPAPTMAMSGVQLAEGCMEVYNDIQKNKKYLYATFLIADGKIQVEVRERRAEVWRSSMQGSSRISRKKTELRTTAGLLCMTMSTCLLQKERKPRPSLN